MNWFPLVRVPLLSFSFSYLLCVAFSSFTNAHNHNKMEEKGREQGGSEPMAHSVFVHSSTLCSIVHFLNNLYRRSTGLFRALTHQLSRFFSHLFPFYSRGVFV